MKIEIDTKTIAEKMIEKASEDGTDIQDYWTNNLMDILEDLYSLETKVSETLEKSGQIIA